MEDIILVNKGTMDTLIINNQEYRVDKSSALQLLSLLQRNNVIDFKYIGFDEYEKNHK